MLASQIILAQYSGSFSKDPEVYSYVSTTFSPKSHLKRMFLYMFHFERSLFWTTCPNLWTPWVRNCFSNIVILLLFSLPLPVEFCLLLKPHVKCEIAKKQSQIFLWWLFFKSKLKPRMSPFWIKLSKCLFFLEGKLMGQNEPRMILRIILKAVISLLTLLIPVQFINFWLQSIVFCASNTHIWISSRKGMTLIPLPGTRPILFDIHIGVFPVKAEHCVVPHK